MRTTWMFSLVALLSLLWGGCSDVERPSISSGPIIDEMIPVSELAQRLRLNLHQITDTHVHLRDRANTVLIFTHSDGRLFVNAKPIGPVGRLEYRDGKLYVHRNLESQIRGALRVGAPPIIVPPQPPGRPVVVDPGHGGHDPGATSIRGMYEKVLNLAVATAVATELTRRDIRAVTTRSSDRFIELEERAAIANRENAQLFVSLHGDSAPSRQARGFTIYVARDASQASVQAAEAIANAMDTTGLQNRGVRRADYRVLVRTRCPAVLIEMGYLSNSRDAALLENRQFQGQLARAIATGIENYLR